jgi:hypothetical protein
MNFPIQPEPPSPPRAQSPTGQAEASILAEVNRFSLQPEASELPEVVSPSHTETSALPRAPPSPVAPEISPETEQNPVPDMR